MRQFQLAYENQEGLEKWLEDISQLCADHKCDQIIFNVAWMQVAETKLKMVTESIEKFFPDAMYYGNETSGNIHMGDLSYGINITGFIFDVTTSRTELLWIEKETEMASLADLWAYCNRQQNLRAVELIPSLSYLDEMKIDGSELPIAKDILVFGGSCVNYDFEPDFGYVMAKGHNHMKDGLVAVLYYGEELYFYSRDILGWKGVGRLMDVTKTSGKIIEEINHEPAFSIYEKYLDLALEDKEMLVFPLIVEEAESRFLRTPQLVRPDKSIMMFVDVQEGAKVRIAYGDESTILNSLSEATTDIRKFHPEVIRSFSCAGRRLFWGDDSVGQETDYMQKIAPVSGFYTGGEILRFDHKLRVLNQTLAIVAIREKECEVDTNEIEKMKPSRKSLLSRLTYFLGTLVNEALEGQTKLEEDTRIIGALSERFGYVDYIELTDDFKMDTVTEIRVSKELTTLIPEWQDEKIFYRRLDLLIERLIYEPDKQMFYERTRHDEIIRSFEDSDTIYINMRAWVNHEIVYLLFQISAVRLENRIVGIVAAIRSVDEQKKKEIETQKQLEDAMHAADAANKSKSEFLFNMSHDIRTPMNAIMGFTAMAKKYAKDEEKVKDYLEKIEISGKQLLTLINQVLEMSRIESGTVVDDETPCDCIERFQSLLTVLSAQARAKGLDFKSSIQNVTHTKVYADDTKVNQIVLNVVSNAMKYTPEGGSISFNLTEVEPRKAGFATYTISVEDTGIGMSQEYIEKIYQPFSREKNSTVSKIQGTGLGMTIVKKLVDLKEGTIDIQSKVGEGTKFDITLDFRIAEDRDIEEARARNQELTTASFEGKRVLLVEDNEMNREIAKDILEEFGFVTEEAEDGDDAVRMCYAAAERGDFTYYDYILMDIQMPRMNGYEATRAIRSIPVPDDVHVPIIAMTANAFDEDKKNALASGMDAHLSKPIEIVKLLETLSLFS